MYILRMPVCKSCCAPFDGHRTAERCAPCKREVRRVRMAIAVRKFLDAVALVKGGPCVDCGDRFPEECMDLDHVDPAAKAVERGRFGRSNRSMSWGGADAAATLIAGTQLVCANCHRVRTETRGHYHVRCPPVVRGSRNRKVVRRAARAVEVIRSAKDGPCLDCARRFPACAMDFDHVGAKRMAVSAMVRMKPTVSSLMREIAKCELVCANCHRVRTHARKTFLERAVTGGAEGSGSPPAFAVASVLLS